MGEHVGHTIYLDGRHREYDMRTAPIAVDKPRLLARPVGFAADSLALEQLKELSATALSWQFPRRLIECLRFWCFRKATKRNPDLNLRRQVPDFAHASVGTSQTKPR